MTAEKLHDALTLLPGDLIEEADRKRSRKPKVIPWKRYAAMAACFVLVLCSSWFCLQLFSPKGSSAETCCAAPEEAPASAFQSNSATPATQAAAEYEEAAPAQTEAGAGENGLCILPTEAIRQESASEEAPAASDKAASTTGAQALCIDHSHLAAAEPQTVADPVTGWCGNTSAVVYLNGEAHTIWGSNAVALTDILVNLDYDPEMLCRCMAEFTADTETDTGYEINLTEYFVRHDGGQAALTEEQAETIREILENLGE